MSARRSTRTASLRLAILVSPRVYAARLNRSEVRILRDAPSLNNLRESPPARIRAASLFPLSLGSRTAAGVTHRRPSCLPSSTGTGRRSSALAVAETRHDVRLAIPFAVLRALALDLGGDQGRPSRRWRRPSAAPSLWVSSAPSPTAAPAWRPCSSRWKHARDGNATSQPCCLPAGETTPARASRPPSPPGTRSATARSRSWSSWRKDSPTRRSPSASTSPSRP